MQVKKNTTVMKTRYINQSPYNKVLWWAIFIKHNLKFELGWAGLGMLGWFGNVGLFRVHAFLLYVLTSKGKNDLVDKKFCLLKVQMCMLCNVLLEIAQHRTYLTLQFRFNIQERVILNILKLHPPNLYAILLQLFHSWTV